MNEYPTEEQLKQIEEWHYKDFKNLALFIQSIWNWGEEYARLSEPKKDTFGNEYQMFELITGGWSGNEDILHALHKNHMFRMMCWEASFRGGHHIYHIKQIS